MICCWTASSNNPRLGYEFRERQKKLLRFNENIDPTDFAGPTNDFLRPRPNNGIANPLKGRLKPGDQVGVDCDYPQ